MVHFPIFERLEVENYGLYPGMPDQPGIDIHFKPGLTLILGVNGLGKTTLITILYRMLAGAYDLPRATIEAPELGGSSLSTTPLKPKGRALFASRVQDLAVDATATLHLSIAQKRITIRRHLKDLRLLAFHVDEAKPIDNEDLYQELLPEFSSVSSFGDWLLLLRQMVFYFEDRKELVWDASAQRHIFRTLFLSPQEARVWYRREREILELDSRYRNDNAALTRMKKRIAADEKAVGEEASLRAELISLTALQEEDETTHTALAANFDDLDSRRRSLRKELLTAELMVDQSARTLESEKLTLLKNYFPSEKQTAQYLYSLLIAQGHCAICGNEAKAVAEEFSDRIKNCKCVVCGSGLASHTPNENIISLPAWKVQSLYEKLEADRTRVFSLRDELKNVSDQYDDFDVRLNDTRRAITERARRINQIVNALPQDSEEEARVKSDFSSLSKLLSEDRENLTKLTTSFKELIDRANDQILQKSMEIKEAFAEFAEGFLAENVQLKWSPVYGTLGQTGTVKVAFPAFDLEMSGSDFTAPVARAGPEAVSESQREFIDLAFRMALIQVASGSSGGSLVIDAPESSLDAFFVKRAADVLCRFGKPNSNNRLVVASNLVDGQLLPEMIKKGIPLEEEDRRLVNLMKIAVPTAALRENQLEYEKALEKILTSGGLGE